MWIACHVSHYNRILPNRAQHIDPHPSSCFSLEVIVLLLRLSEPLCFTGGTVIYSWVSGFSRVYLQGGCTHLRPGHGVFGFVERSFIAPCIFAKRICYQLHFSPTTPVPVHVVILIIILFTLQSYSLVSFTADYKWTLLNFYTEGEIWKTRKRTTSKQTITEARRY